MRKLAILAVLALAACATSIPDTADYWHATPRQAAKTIEVQLVNRGFALYCGSRHAAAGALACADVTEKDKCVVYVNAKAVHRTELEWVVDHEKCHCAGFDHKEGGRVGEQMMRRKHSTLGVGYLHNYCPADTHLMPHTFVKPVLEN